MEKGCSNSMGGTIILLALFAHSYIFGLRYMNLRKHTPLCGRGIIENQDSAMETTQNFISLN